MIDTIKSINYIFKKLLLLSPYFFPFTVPPHAPLHLRVKGCRLSLYCRTNIDQLRVS